MVVFDPSHPTWVRGLKRAYCVTMHPDKGVAPYVGAWIETSCRPVNKADIAWSHPTWVRGLKLITIAQSGSQVSVAPYVGAWIETNPRCHQQLH